MARLQNLCQFSGEDTAGFLIAVTAAPLAAMCAGWWYGARGTCARAGGTRCGGCSRAARVLTLGGLGWVSAQEPVFERCAIEPADDGLHFVAGWRFDESEALGFLRFVVADHFDGVGDEIFGGQPLFDIVGSD